jgi:hypothetical protein
VDIAWSDTGLSGLSGMGDAGGPPPSITTPSITGTAQQGQTLTAVDGTTTPASGVTISRQWNRSGSAIAGATGTTYTLVSADVGNTITLTETPSNANGTGTPQTSAPTATVTAWNLVAHTVGASTSGTYHNATVSTGAINTTGANLIVVSIAFNQYAIPFGGTFTDSLGNTWTLIQQTSGTTALSEMYCCYNPTVGANHTFSFESYYANNNVTIGVLAFSGAKSGLDQSNSSAGASPGSVTPTANNELLVTFAQTSGGTGQAPSGVSSPFTVVDTFTETAYAYGFAHAYMTQGTAAAENPTWSGTGVEGAVIATFK